MGWGGQGWAKVRVRGGGEAMRRKSRGERSGRRGLQRWGCSAVLRHWGCSTGVAALCCGAGVAALGLQCSAYRLCRWRQMRQRTHEGWVQLRLCSESLRSLTCILAQLGRGQLVAVHSAACIRAERRATWVGAGVGVGVGIGAGVRG